MDPTTLGYTVAKVPRREPSFSITERETLCDLVQAHWAVLENKKTDQQSVSEKTARWKLLAEEFNATSCQFRHWQKLKTLWENMKKRAKSALADDLDNQYVTGGSEGKSSSKDPIFLKVMDLIRPQTDPLQIDQEDQECATALKTSTSTRLQEMTAESDWSHSNPAVLKTPHASVPRTWIESSNSPDGCLILEEADDSMFKIDSGQNAAARPVSSQALRTADHPGRRPVLKRSNHQHSLEVEILKLRRDQEKIKLEQEKEKLLQLKLRTAHLKRKLRDGDDWDFM